MAAQKVGINTPVFDPDSIIDSAIAASDITPPKPSVQVARAAAEDLPVPVNVDVDDDTVEIIVLDPQKNDYVTQRVSRAEQEALRVSMGRDFEFVGGGNSSLDMAAYDQRYVYYAVEKNSNSRGWSEAFELGYRPVPASEGLHNPAHVGGVVSDAAKHPVVCRGDLFMMRMPRERKEMIDTARRINDMRRRDPDMPVAQGESILSGLGILGKGGTGVLKGEFNRDENVAKSDQLDRAQELASSLMRSLEANGMGGFTARQAMGGPSTFGGFDGPGAKHGVIPDSPTVRRLNGG